MSFGWLLRVCASSSAPRELSFSSTIISVVLSVVACPSNFLFCFAMYKDPYKNLRTPFNVFILNIAAADFVQGSAVLPLSAAFHGLEGVGKFSPKLLRALHLFFFISCTASIISIAALAVDRCISVSYPLKYRSKSTYSRSIRVSVIIWLISAGLSFLYLQVDFILYIFVFVNCVILLTVIILVFVQFWISRRLKRNRERREFRRTSALRSRSVNMHGRNWNKMVKRDARVTRTFFSILMFFLLLMTPSFVFAYLLNFCPSCDCVSYHIFRDLHFLLVLFPSSINPFLFGWRIPRFRRALRNIISCRSRNVDQADQCSVQIESSIYSEERSSRPWRIIQNARRCHKIFVIHRSKCGYWSPPRDQVCNNSINGVYKRTDRTLSVGILNNSFQRYPEKETTSETEPQDFPPMASDTTRENDYCVTSIL